MDKTPENDQPIDLGSETTEESLFKTDVTDLDKFLLAKRILLVGSGMYVFIATVVVINDPSQIKDVWDYSKVALNSLIAVIIGYYFGKK